MSGETLRDEGLEQAGSGQPVAVLVRWEEKARFAILKLALADCSFNAEDLRRTMGEEPPTPNCMGAAFRSAYRRGWIKPDGYMLALRPSRHASILRCWVRA